MLHFLFNCKPHHILMDPLFVSVITLLVYFFNICVILYNIHSNLLRFLFVELLNPLCLVLDTDLLQ